MSNSTHFGFKEVAEDEKASLVRQVFDGVATRYDVMNDAMSGGLHRLWKNDMVARLSPRKGQRIVDVAGGTGDIAFRLLAAADCQVTVCDINQQMLQEGKKRAVDRNIRQNLEWLCGDAESLPLPDESFDAYTVAFGIRNVTHIDKALQEAYRVLKPGGRFLCLEFSTMNSPMLQKLYDVYSFNVIPKLGSALAGDSESYRYLVESIRRFPHQDDFVSMIMAAGFGNVRYYNKSGGIVALHSARKL